MAYGLQIQSPDGDVLFDSQDVARGTAEVARGFVLFNTPVDLKAGQLIFFNVGVLPLGSKIEISAIKTWEGGNDFTISFITISSGGSPGITGVNYAILEDMETIPTAYGNFGLVCKTGGYVTSFDSRTFQTTGDGEIYIDKYQSYRNPLGHGTYITAPYSTEEWISAHQLEFTSVTYFARTFSVLFSNSGVPGGQIYFGPYSSGYTNDYGHIYEHSSGSGTYNVSKVDSYNGVGWYDSLGPYVVAKTHFGVE